MREMFMQPRQSKHSMRRFGAVTIASACALLVSARAAQASPLLDLMGDTSSPGALQARTVAGGSGAAYFNPALLTATPAGIHAGFTLLHQRIGVQLDGRPATEFGVPQGIMNAGHADGSRFDNYPIPTNLLQFGRSKEGLQEAFAARPRQGAGSGRDTLTYEVIGLVVKLFDDHVALGFHGMIPNGEFMRLRAFFSDEREQYFSNSLHPELYADRMTALSLAFGVGIQLTSRLSLGLGTSFSIAADVGAPTYVIDTGNLGKVLIDLDGGAKMGLAPHFGATYEVSDRLRVSATAHAPQQSELRTKFTFLLPNGIEQGSGVTFVLNYTPWQVALGAAYDLIKQPGSTLTVTGTALYSGWSAYLDRHGARPSPAYAWADVISPTLGVRYAVGGFTTAFDLAYVPTPIPAQTGRTNYVDNDRIGGSLGAEYAMLAWGTRCRFGAQVQVHSLLVRYQSKLPTPTGADGKNLTPELVKDELPDDAQLGGQPLAHARGLQTNNPGWPGFSSGGLILAATAYLSVDF